MNLKQADEDAMKAWLDEKILLYNTPAFIRTDPISIPHRFSKAQDIEIAGFFAATLAWGNRTSIINNCTRLMGWMGHAPHDFILNHQPQDLKPMLVFAHRTFNATDLLYFIETLQRHYQAYDSLEDAFFPESSARSAPLQTAPETALKGTLDKPKRGAGKAAVPRTSVGEALIRFNHYFFQGEYPERTRKHVGNPARGSACKRLCMFLRWMTREDESGVDFGIWKKISPADLICPLDVHVARVAHRLGLTSRANADWRAAIELTEVLRRWRPDDPAIYDYALFGLGAEERF
jgi:uncharacterized protein (TIGR02757 family)